MTAKQKLDDLLMKLENRTFYGMERTPNPGEIDIKYSHGYMNVTIDHNAFGKKVSIEMDLDEDYNVTDIFEITDGKQHDWTMNEINNRKGFIGNYMLYDPRYVLHCAKNIKDVRKFVYRVEIVNAVAQELKDITGITMYADIYIVDNNILQMDIIKQLKSKKEDLMRQVQF